MIPWDIETSTPTFDIKVWVSPKLKKFLQAKKQIMDATGIKDTCKILEAWKISEENLQVAIDLLQHDLSLSKVNS